MVNAKNCATYGDLRYISVHTLIIPALILNDSQLFPHNFGILE